MQTYAIIALRRCGIMARAARKKCESGYYHVIMRGTDRIFLKIMRIDIGFLIPAPKITNFMIEN